MTGTIVKALSGFYYVDCGDEVVTCRARGKFRHAGTSPLVGDRVEVEFLSPTDVQFTLIKTTEE